MPDPAKYDLDYRPSSYLAPTDAIGFLVGRIKGTARRKVVREALEAGDRSVLDSLLAQGSLPEEIVKILTRPDPRLLGGEFLPDAPRGHTEIARIELDSTTWDVTSLRAEPTDDGYAYSVVDEYGSEFRFDPKQSRAPLSMRQLVHLIDGLQHPDDEEPGFLTCCLRVNAENMDKPECFQALEGFVAVSSVFYPQLESWYQEFCREWLMKEEQEYRKEYGIDAEEGDAS